MLRRLAISLAATSALVLTATAPAFAEHGDPAPLATLSGNVNSCSDAEEELAALEGFDEIDFDAHSEWNNSPGSNAEHPNHVEHDWWDASYGDAYGDPDSSLDIVLTEEGKAQNAQLLVLVKAGPGGTNAFLSEPGGDLIGLYAPEVPAPDKHPTISNYTVCKVETPPGEEEEPPGEEEEPPGEEEEEEEEDLGKGGGEPPPAPVPTAVPAGMSGSDDGGSMAPIGIAAVVLMMLAGGAALLRRRFGHQS
jgi:hypothetical protein